MDGFDMNPGRSYAGGQGVRSFEPETSVRREANTFGCRSESPVSGGFTWGIYERMLKKGLGLQVFAILGAFGSKLKIGIDIDVVGDSGFRGGV